MEESKRYVGLDLAKRTYEMCVLQGMDKARFSGGKTDAAGREKLARFLCEEDTVAMEACAFAFVLARELEDRTGCRVLILNPGRLQMIWKSETKTDKSDAWKLADYIQRTPEERMPLVSLPSEEEEELRGLVSMKSFMTKQRTAAVNRLHAVFVQAGMTTLKRSDLADGESRRGVMKMLGEKLFYLAKFLAGEIELLEKQIEEIEAKTAEKMRGNELLPYVMSVPGVGPSLAAAFLAYVGDGSRFKSGAEVAHYVGLTPRMDCSGETNRYGHITKQGCRPIRAVVLNSVWALSRQHDAGRLKSKFLELQERLGRKKSAVAIARKLVVLLWVLARRKEFYKDSSREQIEKKFARYKVNYEGWEKLKSA